jgi:hypothetical protein
VNADDKLRFQDAENYKQNQIIDFVKTKTRNSLIEFHLAPIDLNDDLIDEYVVKPHNINDCANAPLCLNYIVAFKARKPILLGQFDAHKILVSNKKTYGVRDLIVYNVNRNDFKYDTAHWNPFESLYRLR